MSLYSLYFPPRLIYLKGEATDPVSNKVSPFHMVFCIEYRGWKRICRRKVPHHELFSKINLCVLQFHSRNGNTHTYWTHFVTHVCTYHRVVLFKFDIMKPFLWLVVLWFVPIVTLAAPLRIFILAGQSKGQTKQRCMTHHFGTIHRYLTQYIRFTFLNLFTR